MRLNRPAAAILLTTCLAAGAAAELRLPAVLSDHAVLQRDRPVNVWGWADPGQTVEVALAGQQASADADARGRWSTRLGPLEAGGPHELTATAGDETLTRHDLLVGEVWVCSGQSNMDMRLLKVFDDEALAAADMPAGLRLFRVERATSDQPQDDVDAAWAVAAPDTARNFSAAAYFMGLELERELGVPVGLIHTAYGGTPAEAWTATDALRADPELEPILGRWDDRVAKHHAAVAAWKAAAAAGDPDASEPAELPVRYAPGGLFNAMVAPLTPFAVRGAVWYQGESNVWRAGQYRPLLTALINDWRRHWGQDDLPFGVVQLPNYEPPPRVPPGVFSWAELREAQRLVSEDLDHVGLAVTIDIGDPTDIHPVDKQVVGQRLARWALADVYDQGIPAGGPLFVGHEIVGDTVYLDFEPGGTGLAARGGGPLKGFVIAGADRKFRWAKAEVVDGRIAVTEAKVPRPLAVRYAWADNPYWANLTDKAGLPASPFRTDDWPGVTQGSR